MLLVTMWVAFDDDDDDDDCSGDDDGDNCDDRLKRQIYDRFLELKSVESFPRWFPVSWKEF